MKRLVFVMAVVITLCGCNNQDKILEKIDSIKQKRLSIPVAEMEIFRLSNTSDTISAENYSIKLVFYISEKQCQSCYFSQLVKFEDKNRERLREKGLAIICIFEAKGDNSLVIDEILCDAGIKGIIYKDTCDAFLRANPHIPKDDEMYHSFVVDEANNVLMVGSPFYSKKMESLFETFLNK